MSTQDHDNASASIAATAKGEALTLDVGESIVTKTNIPGLFVEIGRDDTHGSDVYWIYAYNESSGWEWETFGDIEKLREEVKPDVEDTLQHQETIRVICESLNLPNEYDKGLEAIGLSEPSLPNVDRYGGDACMRAIEEAGWGQGFMAGNVMKYIWRYEHKGGVEDLRKAQWYLQRLIELEERDD